jgi:hypothetical protein
VRKYIRPEPGEGWLGPGISHSRFTDATVSLPATRVGLRGRALPTGAHSSPSTALPSAVALPPTVQIRILEVYDSSRIRLPPVNRVVARPNVHRLASLGRLTRRGRALNLARSVVTAGEPAWWHVAPALEGFPESGEMLRRLAQEAEGELRDSAELSPAPLRCEGTPEERALLGAMIERVMESPAWTEELPTEVEYRVSRRMTRSLGTFTVRHGRNRVSLSARILRPGLEDIAWETVKHEMAHVADRATRSDGRSDHGPSWRRWAERLRAKPRRSCSREESRRIVGRGDR